MELQNAPDNAVLHVVVAEQHLRVIPSRELEKGKDPDKAIDGLPCGRRSTAGNLALLAGWWRMRRVNSRRQFEHARSQPLTVVHVVERRACKERWKEEHISGIVHQRRELANCALFLVVGELALG